MEGASKGSLGRDLVVRSVRKRMDGVLGRGFKERKDDKRRIEEQGEENLTGLFSLQPCHHESTHGYGW